MKKPIDIEKLVRWALVDEMPKGRAMSTSAWDLIMSYGTLGTRIDVSAGGYDGLGFVPGSPHEDAVAISAAIKDLNPEIGFDDHAEVLGLFGEWAPIAGLCAPALLAARFNQSSLVIRMAIAGGRPAWKFEQPSAYQMFAEFRDPQGALRKRPLVHGLDVDGVEVAMLPNRGDRAKRKGMYDFDKAPRSPLRWSDPDLLAIGESRAEYVAWHMALVDLVGALAGKLAEYEPTLPTARPLPWVTGQVQPSRVLARLDQAPVSPDVLPLSPVRPRAPSPLRRRPHRADLEVMPAAAC